MKTQTQTLSTYHTILQRTLSDLREVTATKSASIDLELATKASQLQQLHDEARSLAARVESSISRCLFLDTSDLVRQEVDGQSSYHHVHKLFGPRPNYVFDLRTKFPIRKYVDSLGDASSWKTLRCEEGGTAFNGEVKTKALKDGRAEVALYGWRREMFASEIVDLNGLVAHLMDSQTTSDTTIHKVKSTITIIESEREVIQRELNDRDQDMRTLGQRISYAPNTTEGIPYLEAASISGLARSYELVSEVMKSEDSTPAIGEAATWLICSSQNELNGALEHIEDGKTRYSNCVSDYCETTLNYLGNIEYNFLEKHHDKDFEQVVSEIHRDLTEDGSSETVRKIYDMALDDLYQLDMSFLDGKESMQVDCEETDTETTVAREATQLIMTELVYYIHLTKRDLRAHSASRNALDGDMRHVGIVAALNSSASASDAWMSIYRGMRVSDGLFVSDMQP